MRKPSTYVSVCTVQYDFSVVPDQQTSEFTWRTIHCKYDYFATFKFGSVHSTLGHRIVLMMVKLTDRSFSLLTGTLLVEHTCTVLPQTLP